MTIDKLDESLIAAIEFANDKGIVYELREQNSYYEKLEFKPDSIYFWSSILKDILQNIDKTDRILVSDIIIEEPVDYYGGGVFPDNSDDVTFEEFDLQEIKPYSSANADMKEELERIHGTEYHGRNRYGNGVIIPGKTLRIDERMEYRFSLGKSYKGQAGITVATFVTSIIGLRNIWVGAISILLGVTGSVLEKIETVQEHICRVNYFRYSTINFSTYMYSMAHKVIEYRGFENKNGYQRAFVATDTAETYYAPSSSYYNDYSAQARDAADMYNMVGQQP